MSAALLHLGKVSRAYEAKADEYITACGDAAMAKAAFTKAKAVFKVEARFNSDKVSDVELESRAHADDRISSLYEDMLLKESTEKSMYEKLRQLREQQANGRTSVVESRAIDQLHAQGLTGAA
jgi:hypothetical protein